MRVQLLDTGPSKIQVVKLLREYTGYSLKECSDIVGMVPCSFDVNLDQGTTRRMISDLAKVGANLSMANETPQQAASSPPPAPKRPETPPPPPSLQETPPPVRRQRAAEQPREPALDWQSAVSQSQNQVEDPIGPSNEQTIVPDVPTFSSDTNFEIDLDVTIEDVPAFDLSLPEIPSVDASFINDIPTPPSVDRSSRETKRDSDRDSSRPRKEDMKREQKRGSEGGRSRTPQSSTSSTTAESLTSDKLSLEQLARGKAFLVSQQTPVGAFILGLFVTAIITSLWWVSAIIDFDMTRFGVILLPIFIAGTIRGAGSAVSPGYGIMSVVFTAVAVIVGLLLRWSLVLGGYDIETGLAIFAETSFDEHMTIIAMHVADPSSLGLFVLGAFIAFFRGYRRVNEKLVRKIWSKIPTRTTRRGDSDSFSRVHSGHTTSHGRHRGDTSERDQHRGRREKARREADSARETDRYDHRGSPEVSGSVERSDSDLYRRKANRRKKLAAEKERRQRSRDRRRNG